MRLIIFPFFVLFASAQAADICSGQRLYLDSIPPGTEKRVTVTSAFGNKIVIYHRSKYDNKVMLKSGVGSNEAKNNNNVTKSWPSYMAASRAEWASLHLRSIHPEFLVVWSPTPNLKCGGLLVPRPDSGEAPKEHDFLGKEWPGGYWEPCFGMGYDFSGRPIFKPIYKDFPDLEAASNYNLVVPEYKVIGNEICLPK